MYQGLGAAPSPLFALARINALIVAFLGVPARVSAARARATQLRTSATDPRARGVLDRVLGQLPGIESEYQAVRSRLQLGERAAGPAADTVPGEAGAAVIPPLVVLGIVGVTAAAILGVMQGVLRKIEVEEKIIDNIAAGLIDPADVADRNRDRGFLGDLTGLVKLIAVSGVLGLALMTARPVVESYARRRR